MRKINEQVLTYQPGRDDLTPADVHSVGQRNAVPVKDYEQLVQKIAAIAYSNPQFLLFFRGQKEDYKDGSTSTLLPALFRRGTLDLKDQYESLDWAEGLLKKYYEQHNLKGAKGIRNHQILRWAVLQHYEIHATPLLDVSYSLRVACTFSGISSSDKPTYVYVLGLPQISGSISVSSEHNIQNIRLLSVCPPAALRPHYQEGHLVGDYPTLGYPDMEIEPHELDFARRLICKFKLDPHGDFQTISQEFLFPGQDRDRYAEMAEEIIRKL